MSDSVELSPRSIDSASNRVRGLWFESRYPRSGAEPEDEGLYTWLHRMATEALQLGEKLESGKIRYAGMKFTFLSAWRARGDKSWHILQEVERVR